MFDVPTIKFVGPTDDTTTAGDIESTKDLVFVKKQNNTISDMDYAAKVIITFDGSDSSATYPNLQPTATITGDQQFKFEPTTGKITIDTTKATADETDTIRVMVDSNVTQYDGEKQWSRNPSLHG